MLRLLANVRKFHPKNRSRRKLPLPLAWNLRVAKVGTAVIAFDSTEAFTLDDAGELEQYRPRVLVGSAADLRRLAERIKSGKLSLPTVDHAIFVITQCGKKPLTDFVRVLLWQAFGVPLYELLISPEGTLLASECEAHEGWHVEPGAAFSVNHRKLLVDFADRKRLATGISGYIETEPCPCGRAGMRLLPLEAKIEAAPRQAFAAIAS